MRLRLAPVLAVSLIATTVGSCPITLRAQAQTAAPLSAADRSRALARLFEEYWQYVLKNSPETATFVGDTRYNDRWSDYSANAANAALQREAEFITQIGAIDTKGLSEQEQLSAELLLHKLVDDQTGARFKQWQMPMTQQDGPQLTFPQVIAVMPFATVKDYDNYIARLRAIPQVFAQVQDSMRAGVDSGRTIPQPLAKLAQQQVATLAAGKSADGPFATPLAKMPATIPPAEQKRIRTEAMEAITTQVLPGYDRFSRFLLAQYIPAARTTLAASALPDGKAYYEYRIQQSTTQSRSAEAIHQLGLTEVKRDEAEMLAIAKKLGYNDLKTLNAALKADPKLHPTDAAQLVDAYRTPLAAMQAKLPELFGRLPKATLEVKPVPPYSEATAAPAYYEQGTPDGKRPGTFFVNTYHPTDRQLYTAETIAFHEGLPGHHLQISIAQELQGVPEFRKEGAYMAFEEGWGLYSEHLGKDVGMYKTPYDEYGWLQADIWRAIRLVVDTGVHSKGWTRQQMVDFFHDHSAVDESSVQSEVDRYIGWPGQALAYKSGQLKLLELRERARTKLGAKFDIRAFHDEVLDSGALPLDVLERRVDAWIAAGGKATSN